MSLRVYIEPKAEADLRAACQWAAQSAPETASRWLSRFEEALQSLSTFPERCGIAPESDAVGLEIRQLLFGKPPHKWRALFIIENAEVHVLHIHRGSMGTAAADDLKEQ